jgi:hypothetical protein
LAIVPGVPVIVMVVAELTGSARVEGDTEMTAISPDPFDKDWDALAMQ